MTADALEEQLVKYLADRAAAGASPEADVR